MAKALTQEIAEAARQGCRYYAYHLRTKPSSPEQPEMHEPQSVEACR